MANVLYGMKNTHNLNLDTVINHAKAVKLNATKSLVVVDMPKNSYKTPMQALSNAKRILKESNVMQLKIENNYSNLNIVKKLTKSKINVMGHIGYTPQFKKKFKVEGKNNRDKVRLIKLAKTYRKRWCFFSSFRVYFKKNC